eukprot:3095214-Lingulodinium_polyedra.AAC.1
MVLAQRYEAWCGAAERELLARKGVQRRDAALHSGRGFCPQPQARKVLAHPGAEAPVKGKMAALWA